MPSPSYPVLCCPLPHRCEVKLNKTHMHQAVHTVFRGNIDRKVRSLELKKTSILWIFISFLLLFYSHVVMRFRTEENAPKEVGYHAIYCEVLLVTRFSCMYVKIVITLRVMLNSWYLACIDSLSCTTVNLLGQCLGKRFNSQTLWLLVQKCTAKTRPYIF